MTTRTFLTGASMVLPDRVLSGGTLVIEGARIAAIEPHHIQAGPGESGVDLAGRWLLPGFIDLHVHGLSGSDVLDGDGAVAKIAAGMPRHGVTSFSPTSLACPADVLARFLAEVASLRAAGPAHAANVLPAHLESNFLNPDFRGAQPLGMLRLPDDHEGPGFSGADILHVIDRFRSAVGIVTLAPELPGGLALLQRMVNAGHLVSLGHSGATFEEAEAAFHAGASRVTHLFSAMSQMLPRAPGLVGAALSHDQVNVELICDGVHAQPAAMRVAISAKTARRVVAISDGTAASALPPGSRTHLGPLSVTARDVARLDDGAMAGSVLTMRGAFETLVRRCGIDLVNAARMCSTTPAEDIRLPDRGRLAAGLRADLVVVDADLQVQQTWIAGARAFGLHDASASRA